MTNVTLQAVQEVEGSKGKMRLKVTFDIIGHFSLFISFILQVTILEFVDANPEPDVCNRCLSLWYVPTRFCNFTAGGVSLYPSVFDCVWAFECLSVSISATWCRFVSAGVLYIEVCTAWVCYIQCTDNLCVSTQWLTDNYVLKSVPVFGRQARPQPWVSCLPGRSTDAGKENAWKFPFRI